MKLIILIKTHITNTQAPGFVLDYRAMFLEMVEKVPEGLTASQMGIAIKIAGKLQRSDDHIVLEDAEWEYLKTKATAWKFGLVAPEIVAMVEAVEKAETLEEAQKAGA